MAISKFIVLVVLISCTTLKKSVITSDQSRLQTCDLFWSPGSDQPQLELASNVYYFKNSTIQQVIGYRRDVDSFGKVYSYPTTNYFVYINADKNICVVYDFFTPEAKKVYKYYSIDSAINIRAWNLFTDKSKPKYQKAKKMSDSSVNSILYRRTRLIHNDSLSFWVYSNCAKNKLPLQFFRDLGDSIGCPIFRIDTYFKNRKSMSRQLHTISDKLSKYELSVFDRWNADN